MDSETTGSPVTPRSVLTRAYTDILAWSVLHTTATVAIVCFVAGFVIGKL